MREEMAFLCYNRGYLNMKTAQSVQPLHAAPNHHERVNLSMADLHYTSNHILRFWKHVDKTSSPNGCWLWTGKRGTAGYGQLQINNKSILTHRFSYILAHGAIPDGMYVCHNCPGGDNPKCVNPAHLWLGTHADNMRDMSEKGQAAFGDRNGARLFPERIARGDQHYSRTHPERVARGDRNGSRTRPDRVARGERCGSAKVTDEIVRQIRRQYAAGGVLYQQLADQYGINKFSIGMIVRRESWRHVQDEEVG